MKKLLFLIPFTLIGCASPEQAQRNLAVMQEINAQQQVNQAQYQQDQAVYQQNLQNQQQQRILDLQEKQLQLQQQQQQNPQTYIITDQYQNSKTITVQPQQNGFRRIPSLYK